MKTKGLLFTVVVLSINITIAQKVNLQKDRHEFIARVNQPREIALGLYVVVQEFQAEAHAKDYAEEVRKSGYNEVKVGHLTNKKSWLVFFDTLKDDIDKAIIVRDKYRQENMFKDAWLLTVHE